MFATRLSVAEMNMIDRLKDENVHTCGSELFTPDHSLAESVVVRVGITCQSPMETQYYGATTVHFPEACYHCGEVEPDMINTCKISNSSLL